MSDDDERRLRPTSAPTLAVSAIVEGRSRFEGDDPDNAADHTIRRILTSFR